MKKALLLLASFAMSNEHQLLDQASIIAEVEARTTTWKAGHNHYFDGKTVEEIKTLMGTILETPEHIKLPLKEVQDRNDIPENFDSAENWPECESLKEVRDQSTCGSCWAFGAVEAMSDRICIASKQKLQVKISSEDLLTCCGASCGNGCNGGFPAGAWRWFKSNGCVTGDLHDDKKNCQPYAFAPCDHHVKGKYGPCGPSQRTPACKRECQAGYSKSYSEDKWKVSSSYGVPSRESAIQTEIMNHGPIEVAFTVYEDFLSYKNGVYHHTTGKALGGHAVKMVGWGVEGGVKFWKIANSWNEGWGDDGFFKIKRGNNECGIEAQGVAGEVILKPEMELIRME